MGALDALTRRLVRIRWSCSGVPQAVTLVLDSTVAVRYGKKQAGAEVGYNPKKPGRPSHHPLVAFLQETGDLVGVLWRPGSPWAGARAAEWIPGYGCVGALAYSFLIPRPQVLLRFAARILGGLRRESCRGH